MKVEYSGHTIISAPLSDETELEITNGSLFVTCPLRITSLRVTNGNITLKEELSTEEIFCSGHLTAYKNLDIINGDITGNCTLYSGAEFTSLTVGKSLKNYGDTQGKQLLIGKNFLSLFYLCVDSLQVGGALSTVNGYLTVLNKMEVRHKSRIYPESSVHWGNFNISKPYHEVEIFKF